MLNLLSSPGIPTIYTLIHLGYSMVVTPSRYGVGKPFQNRHDVLQKDARCMSAFFVRQFGCTAAAFFGKEEMRVVCDGLCSLKMSPPSPLDS